MPTLRRSSPTSGSNRACASARAGLALPRLMTRGPAVRGYDAKLRHQGQFVDVGGDRDPRPGLAGDFEIALERRSGEGQGRVVVEALIVGDRKMKTVPVVSDGATPHPRVVPVRRRLDGGRRCSVERLAIGEMQPLADRAGHRPFGLVAPLVDTLNVDRDRRLLLHAVVHALQPAVPPAFHLMDTADGRDG